MPRKPYNPGWLVALAADQHPDKPWLAEALANCTELVRRTKYYLYFIDPTNANRPGALWQFETNLWLKDAVEGTIVVDVLKDGRVGGIEFYDRLFDRKK